MQSPTQPAKPDRHKDLKWWQRSEEGSSTQLPMGGSSLNAVVWGCHKLSSLQSFICCHFFNKKKLDKQVGLPLKCTKCNHNKVLVISEWNRYHVIILVMNFSAQHYWLDSSSRELLQEFIFTLWSRKESPPKPDWRYGGKAYCKTRCKSCKETHSTWGWVCSRLNLWIHQDKFRATHWF